MQILNGSTLLTNTEANDIFGSVTSFDGDSSLTAFFRAITINHNEGKPLDEIVQKAYVYKNKASDNGDVEYLMKNVNYPMAIIEITDNFTSIDPHVDGWVTYDSSPFYLNRYLSQTVRTKVYANVEKQRVIALVDKRVTHVWVQAFESMLWGVLPWYYPSKSDEIIAFFKSLSIGNKEVSEEDAKRILIKYVNDAAAKLNFRDMRLHKLLDGIADVARQSQIAAQKSNVEQTSRNIENYMRELEKLYGQLEQYTTLLNSLENQEPNKDNSVFSFFNSHKNTSVISVVGDTIKYGVDDTLEFYDEDEAKKLLDNRNGWAVRNFSESLLKYIKAILLEKRGILRVSATFMLTNMSIVSPRKGEYPVNDSMPNPHIYFHACSGGNGQYYSKYAKSGDWDLGVEQSISATKNWSVGDSTVGNEMFRWIGNNETVPCIYVSDGSPIERVTDDMKLVTFAEFKKIVDGAKAREAKESEEVNNG